MKLYLIDGNAVVHRAYHAISNLSTSSGESTNAVFGTVRVLLKILKKYKPDRLAVCFDYPAPTFRHKEYPLYKATRKKTDQELKNQFPIVKEFVRSMGIPQIEVEGFEADDLIASAASRLRDSFDSITVVTGDKDILQLVDAKIKVLNEFKDKIFDEAAVEETYLVPAGAFADYLSLVGDKSDNVPGVEGIGPVAASGLIKEYGSIENIYANISSVKDTARQKLETGREAAFQSLNLIKLRLDAPVPSSPDDYVMSAPDREALASLVKKYEFVSLLKEIPGASSAPREDYRASIIFDEQGLRQLSANIRSAGSFAIDLETTSLDTSRAAIVGISCAYSSTEAFYVPVGHNYLGAPEQMGLAKVLSVFKPLLEDDKIVKVAHNLKYEMMVFRAHGVEIKNPTFDTMVASYCLNPSKQNHGLKDVVFDATGDAMTEIKELIGKGKKQITMAEVAVEHAAKYAAADAHYTLLLRDLFAASLAEKKLDKLFREIEMPLVEVLASMEEAGIKINAAHFEALSTEFAAKIAAVEKEARALAGEDFNLNSPKQLAAILFDKLKLPTVRKTKTGYSTDEEVLTALSARHDLPKKILAHRELAKLKSTYVDAILAAAEPDTRRLHSSFNQTVTATGRLSSSEPNLQNIPVRTEEGRKIRRGFVAQDGFALLSADYSQIDLRVLAHLSADPGLTDAFRSGEDIHARTARELFGDKKEDFESLRRAAKTINFGIIYGMGPFALSQSLGIDQKTAAEYIDNYFARYAGVKKWVESTLDSARKTGSVSTLLGRIRYIPEIASTNAQIRASAERVAMNTPVQGTSADIIKVAMINIYRKLCSQNSAARMLIQVHDDLMFEVPSKEVERYALFVKKEMESAVNLNVPVAVDVKTGRNWDEMEKIGK
ncbi:MAG: DNA polymerase I [Endomicrobiia bacterium]|nr:DNA polymerase I [Endomicrobiia bacterium]